MGLGYQQPMDSTKEIYRLEKPGTTNTYKNMFVSYSLIGDYMVGVHKRTGGILIIKLLGDV
jgi:hypothetical protein